MARRRNHSNWPNLYWLAVCTGRELCCFASTGIAQKYKILMLPKTQYLHEKLEPKSIWGRSESLLRRATDNPKTDLIIATDRFPFVHARFSSARVRAFLVLWGREVERCGGRWNLQESWFYMSQVHPPWSKRISGWSLTRGGATRSIKQIQQPIFQHSILLVSNAWLSEVCTPRSERRYTTVPSRQELCTISTKS